MYTPLLYGIATTIPAGVLLFFFMKNGPKRLIHIAPVLITILGVIVAVIYSLITGRFPYFFGLIIGMITIVILLQKVQKS